VTLESVQRLTYCKVELNAAQVYVNLLNLNILIHNCIDNNDVINFFLQSVSFISGL